MKKSYSNENQLHLNNHLASFLDSYAWNVIDTDNDFNSIEYADKIINQIIDVKTVEYTCEEEENSALFDVNLWGVLKYYLEGGYTLKEILELINGGQLHIVYDLSGGQYTSFNPIY